MIITLVILMQLPPIKKSFLLIEIKRQVFKRTMLGKKIKRKKNNNEEKNSVEEKKYPEKTQFKTN